MEYVSSVSYLYKISLVYSLVSPPFSTSPSLPLRPYIPPFHSPSYGQSCGFGDVNVWNNVKTPRLFQKTHVKELVYLSHFKFYFQLDIHTFLSSLYSMNVRNFFVWFLVDSINGRYQLVKLLTVNILRPFFYKTINKTSKQTTLINSKRFTKIRIFLLVPPTHSPLISSNQ